MTRDPARTGGAQPPRAADDIATFARLFAERRAVEAAGDVRTTANAREMDITGRAVQRHLEHLGRSWLEDADDHGRPESLVAVLAFGVAADYERHADRALEQLREAEALYRAGEMDLDASSRGGRRRRRSRGRPGRHSRRLRIAGIVILAIAMWGTVLAACGSWGPVDDPGVLTRTERAF